MRENQKALQTIFGHALRVGETIDRAPMTNVTLFRGSRDLVKARVAKIQTWFCATKATFRIDEV